jgi:hypothetical protein
MDVSIVFCSFMLELDADYTASGMTANAQASRNGTLRPETNLHFRQPATLKSRARAVVGGRVFCVRACSV